MIDPDPQSEDNIPEESSSDSETQSTPSDSVELTPSDSVELTPNEPVELNENDFASTAAVEVVKPPGPGLPESTLWLLGVIVAQLVSGILVVIFAMILWAVQSAQAPGPDGVMSTQERLQAFATSPSFFLTSNTIFMLIAFVAVWLRLGFKNWKFRASTTHRRLGLGRIPAGHLLLISLVFIPTAIVGGQIGWVAMDFWKNDIVPQFPILEFLDELQVSEAVEKLAKNASLPLLLLMIAVMPAVTEELLFRGVIGRGMVARWGLANGMILTSIMFALVHIFPPHVVALLPLAVLIHVVHIATRSLWAPILLHFLNNAGACILIKNPKAFSFPGITDDGPVPVLVFLTAAFCVVMIGALIWNTRVRFCNPDGSEWNLGYIAAENPPPEADAQRKCRKTSAAVILATVLSIVGFIGAIAYTIMTQPAMIGN